MFFIIINIMSTSAGNPNFQCTMDGYVGATQELLKVALIVVDLIVTTFRAVLPTNLSISVGYAYDFLISAGSFLGYLTAALYFFAKEFGYGPMVCEYSGYVTVAIDYLYQAVELINQMAPAVATS